MSDGGNVRQFRRTATNGNGHAMADSIDLGSLTGFEPDEAPAPRSRARRTPAADPGPVSGTHEETGPESLLKLALSYPAPAGVIGTAAEIKKLLSREHAKRAVAWAMHPTRSLDRFEPGDEFIFDHAIDDVAVWGTGDSILCAEGESTMLAGGQGSGKTTLAQQWALGRAGLDGFETLLGFPIIPGARRVLYLAMDRPSQARRSIRRMVSPARHRQALSERLSIWPGPPPADLAADPEMLLQLVEKADADTVIVDSLKDAALGLSDDAVAAGWNRARQAVLRAGVQMMELHHLRKVAGGGEPVREIDDLFGSTWLTSGVGSVLHLSGRPGDSFVKLRHMKQPAEEVGPLLVRHDHVRGRSEVADDGPDLWGCIASAPAGVTAKTAVELMRDPDAGDGPPSRNEIEKMRRQLERMTELGKLELVPGDKTAADDGAKSNRWFIAGRAPKSAAEGVSVS